MRFIWREVYGFGLAVEPYKLWREDGATRWELNCKLYLGPLLVLFYLSLWRARE